jgi:type VI secretion system protein ImpK
MQNVAVAELSSAPVLEEFGALRLSEVYAPCFILVLQLRSTQEFGDADVLRRRIKQMLDRTERDALRSGATSREAEDAKFALVAFIDETILASDWSEKDRWLAKPLQLELYNRYDAGEEFFNRLDELRGQVAANAQVIEIFYLCMALGFKGRYLIHDQEKLRILIEDTYAGLRRQPAFVAGALSPHGKPRDQVATEVKSRFPTWAVLVFAAVLGLAVYAGMHVWLDHVADETALEIEQIRTTQADAGSLDVIPQ